MNMFSTSTPTARATAEVLDDAVITLAGTEFVMTQRDATLVTLTGRG